MDLFVCDAQDVQTSCRQDLVALGVVASLFDVHGAVDFHDQPRCVAVEIDNEPVDDLLAPEVEAPRRLVRSAFQRMRSSLVMRRRSSQARPALASSTGCPVTTREWGVASRPSTHDFHQHRMSTVRLTQFPVCLTQFPLPFQGRGLGG